MCTGFALAETTQNQVRPEMRPSVVLAANVVQSVRPVERPTQDVQVALDPSDPNFQSWIKDFKKRARAKGIADRVLGEAFDGVKYDADVVRRDRNQSEFTKTIWDYLDSAVSDTRIRNGQAALRDHADTFAKIETRFGVEKEVVAAVWGLESAYGSFRGSNDIIRSLATLAFDGRRASFFEAQLMAALRILASGDTRARNMTGSWAGAMGHTQFMPTSYLEYAVDFTGDGKRDIWGKDPTDALASTAAYLSRFGWTSGQPWGIEVTLPKDFDYRTASRKIKKSGADWMALGVRSAESEALPDHGPGSILLPAGGKGAAFLIFRNFSVIERYNTADAYVIGIGHLSDRLGGATAFKTPWPRGDRALTFDERREMQRRLSQRGFDTKGIDGKIGPLTIAAVRAFQVVSGLVPDGYASLALLTALRDS
ncbi:MAG: lytic murein transglycosylase [Sedimentitalea sp.]